MVRPSNSEPFILDLSDFDEIRKKRPWKTLRSAQSDGFQGLESKTNYNRLILNPKRPLPA